MARGPLLVGLRYAGWNGSPLRAVIFDLDALTDIECDGHREAYNAAFAAHGLDFQWSVTRYRQLLALTDERQRVAAELRKRWRGDRVRCADQAARRRDLHDQDDDVRRADPRPRSRAASRAWSTSIADTFAAGVQVAVVTSGQRSWAEPLVRQLVGEGIVETVVTAEDVKKHDAGSRSPPSRAVGTRDHRGERTRGQRFGLRAARGQRARVWPPSSSPARACPKSRPPSRCGRTSAAASRCGVADCQRLHGRWWTTHKPSAA